MSDLSASIAKHINYLLSTATDDTSQSVFHQLSQFAEFGVDGSILLLQPCLDHLEKLRTESENMHADPLIGSLFKYLLDRPNFSTAFCQLLGSREVTKGFLEYLSGALCLSVPDKIALGLALSDSENDEIKSCGNNFSIAHVEALLAKGFSDCSTEEIEKIVTLVQRSESLCKHLVAFRQMLTLAQLEDVTSFVLAPLLSDEWLEANCMRNQGLTKEGNDGLDDIIAEIDEDISDGNITKELGYGCAVSVPQCKEIFSALFSPLNESTIARILGVVACSREFIEDNQITYLTFNAVLGCNNSSDLTIPSSWNVNVLVDSIKQLAPTTNWIKVVESLDYDGFCFPDEDAFSAFMNAYRIACQEPFPLHAICGSVWNNTEGQLSFLKFAVSAAPESFTFVHASRKLEYVDAVHGHILHSGHANHAWLCLDLLNILCELYERGHADAVRSVIENPLKHCPELLLLGMSHTNTACNLLQLEISRAVFHMALKDITGSGIVHYLWHVNPHFLFRGFADAHSADPDIILRILDICQELKILSSVLETILFSSGIRLAALASRRELIDLERWLASNLNTYKDIYFEECLKFLKEVQLGGSQDPFHQSRTVLNTYLETIPTFSKVLKAHIGLLTSTQLVEEMKKLQLSDMVPNPGLQNGGATESASDGFADDVEAEANSYFHQMFSGQLNVEAMVDMLARLKESHLKREQSIFECIIANLYEEYRFFPRYPERQLKIAALLFGSIIRKQLVTHLTLGIALRRVLDALRKPPDSKLFIFGTKALEQFVDRLIEWPQYCNHILQISHLCGTQPELIAFIERALAKMSSGHMESDGANNVPSIQPNSSTQAASGIVELSGISGTQPEQQHSSMHLPRRIESSLDDRQKLSEVLPTDSKLLVPSTEQSSSSTMDALNIQKDAAGPAPAAVHSSSPGFIRPTRAASSTRFGSAMNIETLVAAAERRDITIEAPASDIQDKVSFIVNNISTANIDTKAKEFTEILREQYYPWFAQYMVMKRASIEPNFHDLYLKFLDKVNSRALYKEIVLASYENCKVLLGSDLIKSSSEERSLLKSLGSWLGKLTIGRNQVLRASHIDLKSLIIEAYEKGLMIAVIPFTSKILEPCLSSLAYRPPNPWTMGILSLLAEIYSMPGLKMNLKFDIEVLYKNLGADLKDISPSCLLKDLKREIEGNPDFSNKDVGAPHPQVVPEVKPAIMPPLSLVELPIDVTSPSNAAGHTQLLRQYASPLHLSSGVEDEKLAALGLTDQLPSAPGLFQASPSQSHVSANQVPVPVANVGNHVVINPKLSAFGLQMHFQRVVPVVMNRAVKEIVSNVVQRSVSVATQTTKELVLKDYASETDDNRTKNAARLMVASLGVSLAHVTCKELLHSSISSQLRNSLQGLNVASELLEQAVQLVTNDNLDLGCAVIEQAATEKAMHTIDGEISQQLAIRRKHREAIGPTFFDANMFDQGSIAIVPEVLRPKPGHLSHSQQRVYEDFVRLPWQSQAVQSSSELPLGADTVNGPYGSTVGQQNPCFNLALGNTGFDTSTRSINVSEPVEDSCSPLPSASTAHVRASEATIQHGTENDPVTLSFHPSVPVESSNSFKDSGPLTQPLSTPVVAGVSEPSLTTGDTLEKYQTVAQKLESLIAGDSKEADIQVLVAEVPDIILRCISRDEAALAVAQKVFKGLYENSSNKVHAETHLAILAAIRDVCKLVVKELTSWVLYSEEERKYNKDITVGLIRSELLNLAEYNMHMAKLIDGGRNQSATEFAISLLQTVVIEEPNVISELHNLVDALAKVAAKPGSPESLQQLVEIARKPSGSMAALTGVTIAKEDKSRQTRDKKVPGAPVPSKDYNASEPMEPDPAGFRDQVSMYFADWYRICEHPGADDTAYTHYILQLHQKGLLKGNDLTDRFICILTELSVSHCLSSEVFNSGSMQSPQQPQTLSFLAIDIYAKLVYLIIKGSNELSLFTKILAVTVQLIQKDAEDKKTSFNPRPYFRLFINWLSDITSLEPITDGANFEVLTAFANTFHALQPLKVPGFSFTWLELVTHRSFMPKLLVADNQKGWVYMQRLLVDLLHFMEPYLRNAELGSPVRLLYRGTVRVFLLLLHDFPDFLSDYYFTFCDVIPASCIQLRNAVLSAFPSNMRLPDPYTPNLKIDLLPEICLSPRILSEVDAALKAKHMKGDVDEYLKTGNNSAFLTELKQKLLLGPSEVACAGTRYNVPLISSLVLYVGMQAIQQLQSHAQSTAKTVPLSVYLVAAAFDIFRSLLLELDTEGRYLVLNSIANQLRYPNIHTHYFSFLLLFLFAESNQEIVQEQITRVLLERLIANRPHPWGLLVTFIELIKNPQYSFWSKPFLKCAPEIEKLFESVLRSSGGPKPIDQSMASGWASDNTHPLSL